MKRNNKKGFTIVELVIVIAVIAILAGVLIPTFAGIITKAKDSAALQDASNTYRQAVAASKYGTLDDLNASGIDAYIVTEDNVRYSVTNGVLEKLENDTTVLSGTVPAAGTTEQTGYALASAVFEADENCVNHDNAADFEGLKIYVPYTVPATTTP